ncbi:peptidase M28 [Halococcus thailandensis JCM 13552]|uniref:Peptidase M28 n=1 Tax=Halococcus thailandensis JCM 13552 TaxID=1227457 RepID=M0MS66_9EURY|nr:peptidase M28 [Halococcus thailandensis JCM 13552]
MTPAISEYGLSVIAEAAARRAAGDSDISHYSSEEIRNSIDAAYERELRVGGRWPYDD